MLVDSDKHPEKNIYFIGARQLGLLRSAKEKEQDIYALFKKYNSKGPTKISFDYFMLGLDWLFLLGLIQANQKGNVSLCS